MVSLSKGTVRSTVALLTQAMVTGPPCPAWAPKTGLTLFIAFTPPQGFSAVPPDGLCAAAMPLAGSRARRSEQRHNLDRKKPVRSRVMCAGLGVRAGGVDSPRGKHGNHVGWR